jgi:hypothetical protein
MSQSKGNVNCHWINPNRMGKEKGYKGLFTTNCNKLTQHIARLLKYQVQYNCNSSVTSVIRFCIASYFNMDF